MATSYNASSTASPLISDSAQINDEFIRRLRKNPSQDHICTLFAINQKELEIIKHKVYDILKRLELLDLKWPEAQSRLRDVFDEFNNNEELANFTAMSRWNDNFPLPNEWATLREQGIKGMTKIVHQFPRRYKRNQFERQDPANGKLQEFGEALSSRRPRRQAQFTGLYPLDEPLDTERNRSRSPSSSANFSRVTPAHRQAQQVSNETTNDRNVPLQPAIVDRSEIVLEHHAAFKRDQATKIPDANNKGDGAPTAIPSLKQFEMSSDRLPQSMAHGAFDMARATFIFHPHLGSTSNTTPIFLLPHQVRSSEVPSHADKYAPEGFSFQKIIHFLESSGIGFQKTLHGVYWFHERQKMPIMSQDDFVKSLWIRKNQLSGEQTMIPYHLFSLIE